MITLMFRIKKTPLLLTTLISFAPAFAQAEAVTVLAVKPSRCISLHQGQTCYQTLHFSWQNIPKGKLCLFQKEQSQPLLCWENTTDNTVSRYKYQFESNTSQTYELRDPETHNILASTQVQVASVYKSSRKATTGWRLF